MKSGRPKLDLLTVPIRAKRHVCVPEEHSALLALVQERSELTLATLVQEWQQRTGVWLPRSTLHDYLGRHKVSHNRRLALLVSALLVSAAT